MGAAPVRRLLASVRFRITAVATLAVGLALVAGAFGLVFLLQAGVVRTIRGDAQLRAAEVAALAQRGPLPRVLPPLTASRLTLVQVVDASGAVEAASALLAGRPPLGAPGEVSRHGDIRHLEGDDLEGVWLVQVLPVTLDGRAAQVVVVTSLGELRRNLEVLGKLLLGGLVVLGALVACLCWIVVGRALRPIEAMRAEVDAITAQALDRRVPEPVSGDEVGRLARTMNAMLDRLERASTAQRRFGEDASHELRTPVANIRTALEVALAHPERADWVSVAGDVLVQDQRAQQLIDELLVLARTDGGRLERSPEPVDLADVARTAAAAARTGVTVHTVAAAPVIVLADPTHLARIVANVVDNAVRFARSRVTVAVERVGAWGVLSVEDDGPGISEADRERVFERFVRLDQHRDRAHGGSGLGLAIVRELVEAAGGSVAFERPAPTSRVVVRLPTADLSAVPQHRQRTMAP